VLIFNYKLYNLPDN